MRLELENDDIAQELVTTRITLNTQLQRVTDITTSTTPMYKGQLSFIVDSASLQIYLFTTK